MSRKTFVLPAAFILAAIILTGCDGSGSSNCASSCVTVNGDGPTINGSGTKKTEVRPVGKFTAIEASFGQVSIERTGTESLTVTADDNLLALFTSDVKDGTLYLSAAKGKSFSGSLPAYKITVSDLRELDVKGSGANDVTKLDGDALSISISGSASVNVAGRVNDLTVSISGSGSCNAAALTAKNAKVVVSGSGDMTVNASDELDAKIAGSGSIRYLGSPKISSAVSGSGSIKQKAM
jgi:Putative auto-transporter adhesin, head GIN domain